MKKRKLKELWWSHTINKEFSLKARKQVHRPNLPNLPVNFTKSKFTSVHKRMWQSQPTFNGWLTRQRETRLTKPSCCLDSTKSKLNTKVWHQQDKGNWIATLLHFTKTKPYMMSHWRNGTPRTMPQSLIEVDLWTRLFTWMLVASTWATLLQTLPQLKALNWNCCSEITTDMVFSIWILTTESSSIETQQFSLDCLTTAPIMASWLLKKIHLTDICSKESLSSGALDLNQYSKNSTLSTRESQWPSRACHLAPRLKLNDLLYKIKTISIKIYLSNSKLTNEISSLVFNSLNR